MCYSVLICLLLLCVSQQLQSQDTLWNKALENLDAIDEDLLSDFLEDNQWLDNLSDPSTSSLDINSCTASDLAILNILTSIEVEKILRYRSIYGPIIHVNELQVIPDLSTAKIHQLQKYLAPIYAKDSSFDLLRKKSSSGFSLIRTSIHFPYRKGYQSIQDKPPAYEGSPLAVLWRYRKKIDNGSSMGLSIKKDAGEQWLSHNKPSLPDLRFHYFKKFANGFIKTLAIGDYTINWGQGLLQYQGFALSKSKNTMQIKRQSEVIRPYAGSSEYQSFRGIASQIQIHPHWNHYLFIHRKKRDATILSSTVDGSYFSTLKNGGLHRTTSEIASEKSVTETILGYRSDYTLPLIQVGINSLYSQFDPDYIPLDRIDQYFYSKGSISLSHSLDFSTWIGSWQIFGEAALENYKQGGFIIGALSSLHPTLDISLLARHFSAGYHPRYSNAFSAKSIPNNEKGLYIGLQYYPSHKATLSFYVDQWNSQWPNFNTTGPALNRDLFFQIQYIKKRNFNSYLFVKHKWRSNSTVTDNHKVGFHTSQFNIRFQISRQFSPIWTWTQRLEYIHFQKENGFLISPTLSYRPKSVKWTYTSKLTYYNTSSFNTRLYSYEPDLRYSYSLPFYYKQGLQLVIKASLKWKMHWQIEGKIASQLAINESTIGSGSNEIDNNLAHVLKLQLFYTF